MAINGTITFSRRLINQAVVSVTVTVIPLLHFKTNLVVTKCLLQPFAMRILFVKMTDDYDGLIPSLKAISGLFGYKFDLYELDTFDELRQYLEKPEHKSDPFDIIYVAAHSNADVVASDQFGSKSLRWADFAITLCGCEGLSERTKIYLGCCSGGVKRVSLVMMHICENICSVAGVPCVISTDQAPLAFHTFLFGLKRKLDDQSISGTISKAIGVGFTIYSRNELDFELMNIEYIENLSQTGTVGNIRAIAPFKISAP